MTDEDKSLVIHAQMDFDKDDVATIAVAEAEKKIRQSILEIESRLKKNSKEQTRLGKKYTSLGSDLIDNKIAGKLKKINAGFKATGIQGLRARINKDIKLTTWNVLLKKEGPSTADMFNTYTIYAEIYNAKTDSCGETMCVERSGFKLITAQRAVLKQCHDLFEKEQDLKMEYVEWRRKLADIPALERQVKAALAKNHLNKTKKGRTVVRGIIDNFEDTIKLIGV